jgi:hypothetical protein
MHPPNHLSMNTPSCIPHAIHLIVHLSTFPYIYTACQYAHKHTPVPTCCTAQEHTTSMT